MVGASPNFSDVHIIRALILLSREEIGRKNLVKGLGIGEGSVRTILKRLRKGGLVRSSKKGQLLSKKGKGYIQKYLKRFTAPIEFKSVDSGKFCSVAIIHKKADRIKTGFEQRDIAVGAGADSVLVLNYKNRKLEFPTKDVRLSDFPDLIEGLKGFRFNEDDVVIISFARTYQKAEDGAVAVALDLIR